MNGSEQKFGDGQGPIDPDKFVVAADSFCVTKRNPMDYVVQGNVRLAGDKNDVAKNWTVTLRQESPATLRPVFVQVDGESLLDDRESKD